MKDLYDYLADWTPQEGTAQRVVVADFIPEAYILKATPDTWFVNTRAWLRYVNDNISGDSIPSLFGVSVWMYSDEMVNYLKEVDPTALKIAEVFDPKYLSEASDVGIIQDIYADIATFIAPTADEFRKLRESTLYSVMYGNYYRQ